VSCYAFVLGYLLLPDLVPRWKRDAPPPAPPDCQEILQLRRRRLYESVAFTLSIPCTLTFIALLLARHALTLNLAANRMQYLLSQVGAGYIGFLDGVALYFLMIGFLIASRARKLSLLGGVALLLFLIPNVLVTNRDMITKLLALLVFASVVKLFVEKRRISSRRVIGILCVIVFLGGLLGLARGGGPFVGAAGGIDVLRPVEFVTASFDMGEFFQETINSGHPVEYGRSWMEDIAYTMIPRAIFPDKPTAYGATRLQAEVLPALKPEDNIFLATFPIGIYGEALVNFGYVGVLATLFLLGIFLKWFYRQSLELFIQPNVRWSSIFFALLYVLISCNSLGYMRSIGQFVTGVFYGGIALALTIAAVILATHLWMELCRVPTVVEPHPPAPSPS
ncbi:MAG TPA: hypothetical protein VKT32_16890, partial [Chthonomonadaceae bacterium]|nr:hypothetical protein [Chthonomonadaceae bacterium]